MRWTINVVGVFGIHDFLIKSTSDYQIFVENTSGVSVEAGGLSTIR